MHDPEESRTRMANAALAAMRPRKGATLVEYALILCLISIIAVGALGMMSGSVNDVIVSVGNTLAGAAPNNGNNGGALNSNGGGGQGGGQGGGNQVGGDQGCGGKGGSKGGSKGCGNNGGGSGNSP